MTAALMIVGTASGVGKSTLVTGLCRLFRQRGLRVAPFKAQNITDRIHPLANGQSMARSSALAALACGLDPTTDHNPVLIVPSSGSGMRLFLNGHAIPEADFPALAPFLFDQAFAAYTRLMNTHDIVVIEGAGSPVELNLLDNDIVNMRFAMRAKVPVVLVGEINRGGVFASVYGTLALMPDEQKSAVKGIIINKFMGNPDSFADGKTIMECITGRPVLGIVPYTRIALEDEDGCCEGPAKTQESLIHMQNNDNPAQTYADLIETACDDLARHLDQHLDVDALLHCAEGKDGQCPRNL